MAQNNRPSNFDWPARNYFALSVEHGMFQEQRMMKKRGFRFFLAHRQPSPRLRAVSCPRC